MCGSSTSEHLLGGVRMRKTVAAVSIVGVVLASVVAFNWFSVTGAAREVGGRPSNDLVDVWASHRLGVVPGEIVYDVRGVQPNASASDVTRTLLQFTAEEIGRASCGERVCQYV